MIENTTSILKAEKQESDQVIRPQSLDEFIGQTEVIENLKVYLKAAQFRQESLDHILFSGPPGLGKTTLARLLSEAQKGRMHQISAPNLKRPGDLVKLLTNLEDFDLLFIDEIHRLPAPVEEVLYTAMEDRIIDITLTEGLAASNIQLNLPPFTLAGATTKAGALSAPFRDRFGIHLRLNYYNENELGIILTRSGKIWNIQIKPEAIKEIAKRSRKTPRVALRLLRRIWDHAIVDQKKKEKNSAGETELKTVIEVAIVNESFQKMQIDSLGLTTLDNQFLASMAKDYQGGPVGLKPLSAVVSEDLTTLEDFVEPFLVRLGFVKRTPRGRMLTQAAFKHIGIEPVLLDKPSPPDKDTQKSLF